MGGVVVVVGEPFPRLGFVEVAYLGMVPESWALPTLIQKA
jgi:hypothetical protein